MLYRHQRDGAEWLASTPRAALLDDPGLGKTITAIVAADRARAHRMLVIAPTCVVWNWRREIEKWSPHRRVQVVTTGRTKLDPAADTIVTTHGLTLNGDLRGRLTARGFDVCVLDESHFFRGAAAKRAAHFYGRDYVLGLASACERVWCLTGTPMPNDASDLWTMCHGLWPDVFAAGFHGFRGHYCKTTWSPWGDNVKVVGNRNVDELRAKLRGKVLRRRKEDALDLPPVRYETVTLRPEVMPQELKLVAGELDAGTVALLNSADTAEDAFDLLGGSKVFAAFRRLCGLAKAEAAGELLSMELASGALPKVVVMAHHSDVVAALAHTLRAYGVRTITGATPAKTREEAVQAFQTDPSVRVIVCNIIAGGTGATLTAASELVFVEMSFVPGENAQAADRIRRIGQDSPCRVRFIALDGTLDEPLVGVLQRKSAMIREVLEPRKG
jgi:SWI/SNF-related matrix-associated actin-dependent regulator 1 of chromatin subfamily A